ncbi:MAG: hypothetical protein K0R90_1246, partial [Oscillospiraceae bacterium]|nr:hypothetical protein [Oscillospiraceae bacterium]
MADRRDITWFEHKEKHIQHQFSNFLEVQKKVRPRLAALRIIIVYVLLGGIWILSSDGILGYFIKDSETIKQIQLIKGWIYVVLSGFIFYFIISKRMSQFKKATSIIFEGY